MKKQYIIFAAVLVVLILAFSITKSYLSSLEEEETKSTRQQSVDQKAIDDLKDEFGSRFEEIEALIDSRLDSLEREYRENVEVFDSLIDSLTDIPPETVYVVDTISSTDTLTVIDTIDTHSPDTPDVPTEKEIAIYNQYLKRRWALPDDLTRYELKVAKQEIYVDIGNIHGMTAKQILKTIDKVYEYHKRGKDK